jgi:hypothetical protein
MLWIKSLTQFVKMVPQKVGIKLCNDIQLMFLLLEIAILLYKFLELIKQGNTVAFDEEYQKLSVSGACTNKNEIAVKENLNNDICEHSEIEENCTPMDQDSEWIEVKSRKRR